MRERNLTYFKIYFIYLFFTSDNFLVLAVDQTVCFVPQKTRAHILILILIRPTEELCTVKGFCSLSPTTLKILLVSRGSLQQKNCVFVCVFLTEEQTHKTCNKTLKCKWKCRDNMLNALYSLGVTIVQGYCHHEISCVTTGNSI